MIIQQTFLTSGGQSSGSENIGDKNTASILPLPNTIVIVAVSSAKPSATPNTPTISGCNITWHQIATVNIASSTKERLTVFWGLAVNPTTTPITISHGGQNMQDIYWQISQFSNADITNGGVNAIVQSGTFAQNSVTSSNVALSAFGNVNNAAFGVVYLNDFSPQPSVGSGMTLINSQNQAHIITSEWSPTPNTNVGFSISGGGKTLIEIAIEIKAAPLGGAMLMMQM